MPLYITVSEKAAYWSKIGIPLYSAPRLLGVTPSDYATTLGDEKRE